MLNPYSASRKAPGIFLAIAVFVLFISTTVLGQSVNLTTSNLPIIVIHTNGQEIPDDPKIVADMGIIYNGVGVRNQINDPFNHYNGKIGIEIRGQSSQMFPQKSYSIELRKANGTSSLDQSMFGLPAESDWVLYAPYTDKTLMRNFLAYTMSRELGHWASNIRFVEVIINNDYRGVYMFMERIKRNAGRVNITKMAKTDNTGDAVTGGYIFSLDKEPNGWFSGIKPPNSANGNTRQFSYVVPKVEDISTEQKAYIKSYVDSFELALNGPKFQDPLEGVRRYADLHSFMDFFFVNEISRNVDGYRLSSYFYKDRNSVNGKIIAGPVWDFDLAFRNANYCSGSEVSGWAYNFNYSCPGDGAGLVPFWWEKLMKDTAYTAALRCRWIEARQNSLSLNRINHLIDSVKNLLSEAEPRHHTRWPVLGTYVWPNPHPIPANYVEEISTLKSWISARVDWIDKNMPNTGSCSDWVYAYPGSFHIAGFPNPFTGGGNLVVESKADQLADIQAFDVNGHVLMRRTLSLGRGQNQISLRADAWPRGVYVIRVINKSGEQQQMRMVKY